MRRQNETPKEEMMAKYELPWSRPVDWRPVVKGQKLEECRKQLEEATNSLDSKNLSIWARTELISKKRYLEASIHRLKGR